MKYDPLTRILHLCLAAGVTAQMLTSLVMVYPKPGRLPNQWYEVHEVLGAGLLGVLVLHWLWSVGRSLAAGSVFMLFPWFSARRLRDLGADVRDTVAQMRTGHLPDDDQPRPLPSAVQGLGLMLGSCPGEWCKSDGVIVVFGGLRPPVQATAIAVSLFRSSLTTARLSRAM